MTTYWTVCVRATTVGERGEGDVSQKTMLLQPTCDLLDQAYTSESKAVRDVAMKQAKEAVASDLWALIGNIYRAVALDKLAGDP